jgi:hypothetical protein
VNDSGIVKMDYARPTVIEAEFWRSLQFTKSPPRCLTVRDIWSDNVGVEDCSVFHLRQTAVPRWHLMEREAREAGVPGARSREPRASITAAWFYVEIWLHKLP